MTTNVHGVGCHAMGRAGRTALQRWSIRKLHSAAQLDRTVYVADVSLGLFPGCEVAADRVSR
ncbi:MAG: hypothetical protein QOI83_4229, partial [Streptomycetaceae bacterium]|nr:hypothetical protein [Streptomycetaceae bacterium]